MYAWYRRVRARLGRQEGGRPRIPARTVLAVESLEDRLAPATVIVNTLADTSAVNANVSALDANGNTSLRSAIQYVNTLAGPNNITFQNAQGSWLTGTISLGTALPALSGNITINGPGMNNLVLGRSIAPGTPTFAVLTVAANMWCTVSGLNIVNGNGPPGGGILMGPVGGGIVNGGTLFLNNVDLDHNTAQGGDGGGIYNQTGATLVLNSCQIWENSSARGAGVANFGTLYVNDGNVFSHNHASSVGGGIYNGANATMSMSYVSNPSQILGNDASRGGGIYNTGNLGMTGGLLSGNMALTDAGLGGGLYDVGSAQVQNVTFAQNSAISGGGFYLATGGSMTLQGSTFNGNSATASGAGYYVSAGSTFVDQGQNTFQ
jgi:hypothetical protein